jgi:hypothetical protein
MTDKPLLTKPMKCLLFCPPLPKGEAMKQAWAWHQEQLLDLRCLWELCQQHQVDAGLIPMTHLPMMISDHALGVASKENTAMDTLQSSSVKKKVTNSRKKQLLVNKSQQKVNFFDFFFDFLLTFVD